MSSSRTIPLVANRIDDETDKGVGRIHVFSKHDASWSKRRILTPPESAHRKAFGTRLATDGNTLVVGAPTEDRRGEENAGAAHVFEMPSDSDGDGVRNADDNCPEIENSAQNDTGGDGGGDACDSDTDGDDVEDSRDNCPATANSDQDDRLSTGCGCRQTGDHPFRP